MFKMINMYKWTNEHFSQDDTNDDQKLHRYATAID